MNRTILVCLALACATIALPGASAAQAPFQPQQNFQTPPLCSTVTGDCVSASVTAHFITDPTTGTLCPPHSDGLYYCTIDWTVTTNVAGPAGCGWAYMIPTGAAQECVVFGVGIGSSNPTEGSKTYPEPPGTPSVTEPVTVCVDYGLKDLQTCKDYPIVVTLPNFGTSDLTLGNLLSSALETVQAYVDAVTSQLPSPP